ncbi:hypothetical protein AVEN_157183-2 [Araneus ventricosus]|uniref:Uncharacterized protein n=1 Tax=Araneus ventricosus TaxID=182803 RepID=A0A4Y2IZF8_ARAVE|nr:hypothetical protein AVEN_157183-2 [Araneus ventricosus]
MFLRGLSGGTGLRKELSKIHSKKKFIGVRNTVGHQPQQMALPSCVRSEDEAVENREKTTRRDERRWFGSSRPKHEMKRRDDLKDDIRC